MQAEPNLGDLFRYLESEFSVIKSRQNDEWKALDEWRAEEARVRVRIGVGLLILVVLLTAYNLSLTSRLTALEAAVYRRAEVNNNNDEMIGGW